MLGESSSHSTSLLGAQVQWQILLFLVEFSQVVSLSLADNSQHSGN